MIRTSCSIAAALMLLVAGGARAELAVGAAAPDFSLTASLAGKPFQFALADALAKGPVVMYFYPAAFTSGCTVEAHEFAEASDDFKALGATLIGVSSDDIETLHRFSVSECRDKFAVASDPGAKVAKAYDAVMFIKPSLASRTSYVIAPDGTIVFVHNEMKPEPHIALTLEAVRKWRAEHPLPAEAAH